MSCFFWTSVSEQPSTQQHVTFSMQPVVETSREHILLGSVQSHTVHLSQRPPLVISSLPPPTGTRVIFTSGLEKNATAGRAASALNTQTRGKTPLASRCVFTYHKDTLMFIWNHWRQKTDSGRLSTPLPPKSHSGFCQVQLLSFKNLTPVHAQVEYMKFISKNYKSSHSGAYVIGGENIRIWWSFASLLIRNATFKLYLGTQQKHGCVLNP